MTKAEWGAIYYFKPEEFDSPDKPGSGLENMQYDAMRAFDAARKRLGYPMHINSGFRTKKHNAAVGGRKNSAHTRGWAGDTDLIQLAKDMKASVAYARSALLDALEYAGFNRMGVYKTFVHADLDPSLPRNVKWVEGE